MQNRLSDGACISLISFRHESAIHFPPNFTSKGEKVTAKLSRCLLSFSSFHTPGVTRNVDISKQIPIMGQYDMLLSVSTHYLTTLRI